MKEKYVKKEFLTKKELEFYNFLKQFEIQLDIKIIPQVNLGSIIHKKKSLYRNELNNRNIDFGIFDDKFKLLFLIEFNDKSHNQPNRKNRDNKVKKICKLAGIKLISVWYEEYYNNKEKVKNIIEIEIKWEKEKIGE